MRNETPQRRDWSCVGIVCNGKMLLVRTSANPEFWRPTGGRVEEGETPLDAAVSEAYEEAGIELDPDVVTHLLTVVADIGDGKLHFHLAAVSKQDIWDAPNEIVEYRWVTANDATNLPMMGGARQFLQQWSTSHAATPDDSCATSSTGKDHTRKRVTINATMFVPLAALTADDAKLKELGARNVHFGRIEEDTEEIQVKFEYDPEVTSVREVFKYLGAGY